MGKLLTTSFSGLHSAAFILGSFSLVSQVLAVVRDRLFAHAFGNGALLDSYYAAFRIPDLLFIVIGSVVSVSVAVPLLSNALKHSHEEARRVTNRIFSFFGLTMIAASAGTFILMPLLVSLLFSGFDVPTQASVVSLSRIILLSPFFLGISSLFSSIIQVERRFFIYSISPLLYNIGIILGVIVFYPILGTSGLAWGVALGAFFHMAFQLPSVYRSGLLPSLTSFSWKEVFQTVMKPSVPRTLTLSLSQLLFTIMLVLAASIDKGSVTLLSWANNLYSVPLSLIGVSYSVSAFSILSEHSANKDTKKFSDEVARSLRWILFFSVPFTILFIIFSEQIVGFFLGSGKFGTGGQEKAGQILLYLSIGIFFQSASLLLTRAFYAFGQTAKPLLSYGVGFVTALVLLVFAKTETDLAIAFTASSLVTSLMLFYEYQKEFTLDLKELLGSTLRLLGIWIPAGAIGFWLNFFAVIWLSEVGYEGIVVPTAIGVGAGVLFGFWLLSKSVIPEAVEFVGMIRRSSLKLKHTVWNRT